MAAEHTNRLIAERSPYLQQHAHNPVDWYPWGPEAFDKAVRDDQPVFLSVGYSTCYWCHVMERESFEDAEVARRLNEGFVSIKVDREERPDIDQIYLNAVQVVSGAGGWPMSVFLTPRGKPFFGGTYFPRQRFLDLLARIAAAYKGQRATIEQTADKVAEEVAHMSSAASAEPRPALDRALVERAIEDLRRRFDAENGGFGGAPKFPPHNALPLLFQEHHRTQDAQLLGMATRTLEAIALGGIHDHVGGGFHRYATDAHWLVPHFEKMLYDNALLLRAYVDAYLVTHDAFFRRPAEGIYAWATREMSHFDGGFYSALDAETEGVEGKFYLWTKREILDVLGAEDGELFCRAYDIQEQGNYRAHGTAHESGASIPHLKQRLSELARESGMTADALEERMAHVCKRLLKAREARPRSRLDNKILTAWNGLMIGALAYAGRQLEVPQYTAAAEAAARFVLDNLRRDGKLLRRWCDGEAKYHGYLDDYSYFVHGLLELHEAAGGDWRARAKELMDALLAEFWDEGEGGFFFSAADAAGADGHVPALFIRPKEPFDGALPAGGGIAEQALIRLAGLTGEQRYLDYAVRALEAVSPWMTRMPRATESHHLALAQLLEVSPTARRPAATRQQAAAATTPSKPPPAQAEETPSPVRVEAVASRPRVGPGETLDIAVRLHIAPGWHINAHHPPQPGLVPTSVAPLGGMPVIVHEVSYPKGKRLATRSAAAATKGPGGPPLAPTVYTGSAELRMPVTVLADATPGERLFTIAVSFQACDDRHCLAPQRVEVEVSVEIVGARGGR